MPFPTAVLIALLFAIYLVLRFTILADKDDAQIVAVLVVVWLAVVAVVVPIDSISVEQKLIFVTATAIAIEIIGVEWFTYQERQQPRIAVKFRRTQILIVPALWQLLWRVNNDGGTTVTGVGLTLDLVTREPETDSQHIIVFENLAIIPQEKGGNGIPIQLAMSYEQGVDRFFVIPFARSFAVDTRGKNIPFEIGRDENGNRAPYTAIFQFSGSPINDEDREWRYKISFDAHGLPDVSLISPKGRP
jgi:hypothetical protein